MAGFTTLNTAVSGLRAAQAGLYVTGHNMSNSATAGYTRQRADQHEFFYNNIGYNGFGVLQRGLGTDISQIQQIRDKFIDITYRQETSKAGFYSVKAATGLDIQTILGEMQSAYNAQSVFQDMWNALNELSVYQPGLETRANFISTAVTFVDKVNNVAERLYTLQQNLDLQIRNSVQEVNRLITKIQTLNLRIVDAEVVGDHANDYRDERNRALDELSGYLDIEYKELPGGRVDIYCEGKMLLVCNDANYLSLKYTSGVNSFVEPVFTGKASTTILPYDAPASSYYTLYDLTGEVSSLKGNDKGLIKGLMVARGYYPATYATEPKMNFGPTVSELPNPNDPAYTHGALPAAYVSAYNTYQSDFATWLSDYNNYKSGGPPNTVPLPPEPPDPNAFGGTTGVDAAFLADYDNYMAGEYNAFMKYAAQFPSYNSVAVQYKKDVFNVEQCMIPKVQKEFDTLVHSVIKMINDAVSPYHEDPPGSGTYVKDPNAPFGMDGTQYTEVFVRKSPNYSNRFDAAGNLIGEDPANYYSLYTVGNYVVNPILLNTDGYTMLALMPNMVDIDDTSLALSMMEQWKDAFVAIGTGEKLSVDDAYKQFITNIATESQEAIRFNKEQATLIAQIENKRQAINGVSLDEEMTNMLTYQHAYNASARMINQIDDMLDRIINKMGRAGL